MDNANARRLLDEALLIDPNYAGAVVLHGLTFWWDARFNKTIDLKHSLRRAEDDVERALSLNPDLGSAYMLRGAVAWLRDDHSRAIKFGEQAVNLSPSDSNSIGFLAVIYMYAGEYKKSTAALKLAMRLCPQYPPHYTYYLAFNNLWANNFPAALELGQLYLSQEANDPFAYTLMATILAFQGDAMEAAQMIGKLRERWPDFSMTEIRLSQHYRDHAKLERVVNALRQAGLPD